MNIITLNDTPLIQLTENFLSDEECKKIISRYDISNKSYSKIISDTGEKIINTDIITSKLYEPPIGDSFINLIIDKVSSFVRINKNSFEPPKLIHYGVSDKFDVHQDFFTDISSNKDYTEKCLAGGNRISTIILYLNDVAEGGETHFPWLNVTVKPKLGNMLKFNYNYDNFMHNIYTQHSGEKIIKGDKWILVIWVREYNISSTLTNYNRLHLETNFINNKNRNGSIFSLEVKSKHDTRKLIVEIPPNNHPMNTILVPYTGGVKSSLLLYILGALNKRLDIPYKIQPILINYIIPDEDISNTLLKYDLITKKIDSKKIEPIIICDIYSESDLIVETGILSYEENISHHKRKLQNIVLTYIAKDELSFDASASINDTTLMIIEKFKAKNRIYPFYNLEPEHLENAIEKLNISYFIKDVDK